MKPENDPPRLLDARSDLPDAVREALSAGRGERPEGPILSRMAARLPVGPAPGGAGPPGGAPGAAGLSAAAAPSVLPGVIVGAVLGAVVSFGVSVWMPVGDNVSPAPARGGGESAAAAAPNGERPAEPRERPAEGAEPGKRAAGPQRASPTAEAESGAKAAVADPSGNSAAGARAPESQGAGGTFAQASDTAALPGVEEGESALVRRAQEALSSNPSLALALANQHLARYPGGKFAQEREVIAISALKALGRADEARSRAGAFVSAHPGSAYRPRVEALSPESGSKK